VTLGAWPASNLARIADDPRAIGLRTGWEVPVLSMRLLDPPDTAVTLYWDEKEMKSKEVREVGFTFGLGLVEAREGNGELALMAGGSFAPSGDWTLVALVKDAARGQVLAVELPEGLTLAPGVLAEQEVPPRDETGISPVTWRVRSARDGRYTVKVFSTTNVSQVEKIFIRKRPLLD
jgi:hypothetical protein